jgi:hypothetical protein
MKFTIGAFDSATRTVPVTFKHNDVIHRRSVNAVTDEAGMYDRVATRELVAQVGVGVEEKIRIGVIKSIEEDAAAPAPLDPPENPA